MYMIIGRQCAAEVNSHAASFEYHVINKAVMKQDRLLPVRQGTANLMPFRPPVTGR